LIKDTIDAAASFTDCFFSLLWRLSSPESKDLVVMLWCLWHPRNDKVWDGELKPIDIAIQLARKALFQLQEVRKRSVEPVQNQ